MTSCLKNPSNYSEEDTLSAGVPLVSESLGLTLNEKIVFGKPQEIFNLPVAESLPGLYRTNKPFPYLVIDNFFKEEVLELIEQNLYDESAEFKKKFTDPYQRNKTISTGDAVPLILRGVATQFSSPLMIRYIESITGITRLLPDPYYNTDYGYYHIVGSGGVLGSHVDHSHHSKLGIPHVLNLVVYISKNWNPDDGGELCLYDAAGKTVLERIVCSYNRAVIFECSPTAFHGVAPINETSKNRRHSLYFAYYTVGVQTTRQGLESYPRFHASRSNTDEEVSYGTYFVVRLRDLFKFENWIHLRIRLVYFIKLITPPLLYQLLRRLLRGIK
jgi:hypothetical protein